MAFFTFTTVSGSAATNNLVQKVTQTSGAGEVAVKLVNGIVTYFNADGTWTSTGNTLDAYAPGGLAANTVATASTPAVAEIVAANATTAALRVVTTDLASFQTAGFVTKANEASGFGAIDATNATSAQIDAFIANHTGAATNSLFEASLNASQFYSLGVTNSLLAGEGVVALNATGATSTQVAAIVAAMLTTVQTPLLGASSVENLSLSGAQFVTANLDYALFATGAATVNAFSTSAGTDMDTLLAAVLANTEKVTSVSSIHMNMSNLTDLVAVNDKVAQFGVIDFDAGTGAVPTGAAASIVANRALFTPGSISAFAAENITLSQFLQIPNKFDVGGVVSSAGTAATSISLANASSAQIDALILNASKLGSATLSAAEITAAQFSGLTSKLQDLSATVDASGATDAQTTAIINNLGKFVADGLTDLTLTPAQVNSLSSTALTALNTAVPASGLGTMSIVGTTQFSLDASGVLVGVNVTGSSAADSIQMGTDTAAHGQTAATVQGGMGADVIVGTVVADSLSGGNAADTIIGAGGADTITGGMSIAQQYFTGDSTVVGASGMITGAADRFVMNGGNNVINDLGYNGVADVIVNSSGVTTVANVINGYTTVVGAGSWTATAASSNAGSLTINAGTAGSNIDARLMVATSAVTLVGSAAADTLQGTAGNDEIRGGNGADSISGYLGENALTGGYGNDTFNITTGASDIITDLGKGGGDVLIVGSNATVNATVTNNWTAGTNTANAGTAVLEVNNGVQVVDLNTNSATGAFTITASGNTVGLSISGSSGNDTIVGSLVADTIVGGAGSNKITGSTGGDTFTLAGTDTLVYTAAGQTYAGVVTSGTTVLTGIDNASGMGTGDKFDISAITTSLPASVAVGTTLLNGVTGSVALVQGDYASGIFTAGSASTDHDVLVQWDTNGTAEGGVESVVIIGTTAADGLTGATIASGVLTLV